MGMMSHAAVLRSDNKVFAHLHPTGNYSMAAQMIFDDKIKSETGANPSMTMITPTPESTISIPYEFPTVGALPPSGSRSKHTDKFRPLRSPPLSTEESATLFRGERESSLRPDLFQP